MLHHLRAALARARELFRRRSRVAAEQDEEFAFHLEMETAENVRRGMSASEARRVAVLRFGGTQRFREDTSDARGVVALDNLARDGRFAVRRLRRSPGFATGVLITLGIGIGAAVGIGSIVYGVLLRDLPFQKPDRLVRVGFLTEGLPNSGDQHSAPTYIHFAKSARSFAALGGYNTNDQFTLTDGDAPERVTVAMMTPSLFGVLGVRPLLGELFEPGDTSWSNPRSAILISENLWRRRYGADPKILGRRIDINRGARFVIGVLPRSFAFPSSSVDLYYPAALPVAAAQITSRWFTVIGRLGDGVTALGAEAELNALVPSLAERFPPITPGILQQTRARVTVESLKDATVAPVRPQLVLLGVLVAVVLLMATTNVVNLFLLRSERVRHEIAIARSLGASRTAVAQRFVVEGIVLGLASTLVAIPAAALVLSTKFGFTEVEIPRLHEIAFTASTLGVIGGCAILLGAAVGLIALLRVRTVELSHGLRASRSTSSRGWRRAQNGLVAFQVAIALMLLIAAGLLGRSFWNLHNAKIGFDPANAMTFQVSLPWGPDGYASYGKNAPYHGRMIERLSALPGVSSVGVSMRLPLASRGPRTYEELQTVDGAMHPSVDVAGNLASPDYFRAMGIPLLAGRSFRSGDLRGSPAAIVSERLATMMFGTADVVGRRIKRVAPTRGHPGEFTIVGVVSDVHWESIEGGYAPMVYYPLLRDSDGLPADSTPVPYLAMDVNYAVRGTQLPATATIQAMMKELDHRIPPTNVRPVASVVADATARVRLTMLLNAVAGGAALLLGVIGVYTVVSYAANGRLREFGIRLALGAAPSRVGGMVLGDGSRIVLIGTIAGLAAAFGATRFLRALLYEVKPTSVAEFGIATLLLMVVTMLATLLPARRAARTPPAVVLRGD